MATATELLTWQDVAALPRDGRRYDLLRGELISMSPAGFRHGKIANRVGTLLGEFVREHGLGEVVGAETGFLLDRSPDILLAPDVAFVRAGRLPPEEQQEGYLALAPDLVVEITSPSDRWPDVMEKVDAYLDYGAQLVWVLDPRHARVRVFDGNRQMRTLSGDAVLDGGTVLVGFRVAVADLFR